MVGHERYKTMTAEQYEKKTLMHYLCRIPADKVLVPIISQLQNKKILDVGIGTGAYTKLFFEKNRVTGVDRNPHLCKLPVIVHEGDATELHKLVGQEKFDIVLSTWMTDYLNREQLQTFFGQAKAVLDKNGRFISTFPSTFGFGIVYVTAAKWLRGIDKFTYRKNDIAELLREAGFGNIDFRNLNGWFFPWAFLAIAE